ncbi:hypothetical protein HMPREF1870_01373 [Bacteroidales bacterium KA00344]|nr:hypothetical protein HMPREF1870_01373 [Bacteroidales bacterium KA00344]
MSLNHNIAKYKSDRQTVFPIIQADFKGQNIALFELVVEKIIIEK